MDFINTGLTEPIFWLFIAALCLIFEMMGGLGLGIAFAIPAALTGLVVYTVEITDYMVVLAWFVAFSVVSGLVTWRWFKTMNKSSDDINSND